MFGITISNVFCAVNDPKKSALLLGITILDGFLPKVRGATCCIHYQDKVVQDQLGCVSVPETSSFHISFLHIDIYVIEFDTEFLKSFWIRDQT